VEKLESRNEELARVLREVSAVIDAMQAPAEIDEAFPEDPDEDRASINDQHCFGTFRSWGLTNIDGADNARPVVIEWPDLSWARDQITKVLAS
jgi:hypothetical protein